MTLCTIRAALLQQYHQAGRRYSDAVKSLSRLVAKSDICSKDLYDQRHTGCEIARADVNRARVDLDTHIVEHQCGVE